MPAAKKRTRRTGRPRAAQLPRAADEGRESLDFYLQEISRIPLLKVEEETALARRAFRGDVEAQEKLARHNVRFVVSVAKKFQNRGVPLMDLIGEGNLGLMTAARKFDPDRGRQVHLLRGLVDSAGDPGGHRAARAAGSGAAQPDRRPQPARPGHDAPDREARPGADHRGAGQGDRAHPGCGAGAERAPHRGHAARSPGSRGRRSRAGWSASFR